MPSTPLEPKSPTFSFPWSPAGNLLPWLSLPHTQAVEHTFSLLIYGKQCSSTGTITLGHSPAYTRLFISDVGREKAEFPTLSQARPLPVHTHRADVSSLAPVKNKPRAWRPRRGTAARAKKPEPESCTSQLSYPLQGLNVPLFLGQLSSTSKISIADSHHGGQLPLHCPLQGLESVPRRALPSCGWPLGPTGSGFL